MQTKVKIDEKTLIIRLSLQKPVRSSTGKTLVIASTHGTIPTEARLEGKQVSINVNAFVYPNQKTQPE